MNTSLQLPWAVVVDDDADLAETIADALNTDDCEVAAFTDSTQALAAVLSRPPALIICDVEMPGINGITFAAKVLEHLQQCTIVLMSGSQLPNDGATLIAQYPGRCSFCAKPISISALRTLLDKFGQFKQGASGTS